MAKPPFSQSKKQNAPVQSNGHEYDTLSELDQQIVHLHRQGFGLMKLSKQLGIKWNKARRRVESLKKKGLIEGHLGSDIEAAGQEIKGSEVLISEQGDVAVLRSNSTRIKTVDQLLQECKYNAADWTIERSTINSWEVARKNKRVDVTWTRGVADGSVHDTGKFTVETMWQVTVTLARKKPRVKALDSLLEQIKNNAPVLIIPEVRKKKLSQRRSLELCLMDPHIGLLCQQPEAGHDWDLDQAEHIIFDGLDDLIGKASIFGPFEECFLPFGNDFVHCDTLFHETSAGTVQPEAISWHRVYDVAQRVAINMIERVRQVSKKVYIYEIPGNHSRITDFTLARLLQAYFRQDEGIVVDASPAPYKFHRYGVNLIGFEHGHSIKPIRLAALMANECRDVWHLSRYREWHLGDQHRKGSSNPVCFEEQGVSVEYIPGLTAVNEWHKLKSFSHQQRGAVAFVWDYNGGPIARLNFNIFEDSLHKFSTEKAV